MSTLPSKICGICGEDCAGRPRTKDPQGRYFCRSCYDEALARKQQSSASPSKHPLPNVGATVIDPGVSNDELFADAIEAPPVETMSPCPSCGAGMPAGAALCVSCGYSPQTGGKLSTKKMKAPREKRSTTLSAFAVAGGVVAVSVIWFLLSLAVPAAAIGLLFIATLAHMVVHIVALVCVFQQSILHGLASLFIPIYSLVFITVFLENRFVKLLWVALFVASMLGLVAFLIQMPDDFTRMMDEARYQTSMP